MNQNKNSEAKPVIVAVDHDGSPAAVRFAVAEARRTGAGLRLVHVLQYSPVGAFAYENAKKLAEDVLVLAREVAEESGTDVEIESTLVDHGRLVDELVARAEDGQMIVLEHRRMSRLHRLMTGSTVNGVASRAYVPVVSVNSVSPLPDRGLITAAIQDSREAEVLLGHAFAQAASRGAELVVLHAWWLDNGFDPLVHNDQQMHEEWQSRETRDFAPVMKRWQETHPDVRVSVQNLHAPPAQAALEAAERSDLLVIGRRHHRLPIGSHLGPVARAILDHSACPVLVTPEMN